MRRFLPLLALFACGCLKPAAPEPVQLGQVVPLTGPEAARGESMLRGVRLAVEAANVDGVNGKRVIVTHADSASTAEGMAAQAVRLDALNDVAGLFAGVNSEQAAGVAATRVPPTPPAPPLPAFVTAAGWVGTPTPSGTFAVGLTPAEQGRALGKWAAGEAALRRDGHGPLAVLADDREPTSVAAREAFEREYAKDGRAVRGWAFSDVFDLTDRAKEVVAAKPAGVAVFGRVSDLLRARRWLLRAGLPADLPLLFAGDGEAVPALLAEQDPPGAGAVVVSAFDPADPNEPAKGFIERYRAKFGDGPDVNAALAHDSLTLFLDAARKAGSFSTDKVRSELAKLTDADIVTGKLWFAPDRTARRPVFVLRVQGGTTARLARTEADAPPAPPPAP